MSRRRLGTVDGRHEQKSIDVRCDLAEVYRAQVADFVEVVRTASRPRTTVGEGLAALRLADAIKRASTEAGSVTV